MNTEAKDAVPAPDQPTPKPGRNGWKLASIALAILAAILLVVIIVLLVAGSLSGGGPGSSPRPGASQLSRGCVTFDEPPYPRIGSPTQPGTAWFTTADGIVVRVQPFVAGGGGGYGSVQVVNDVAGFSFKAGPFVTFDQAALEFDFDGLPFDVNRVELQYMVPLSGLASDLGVNGADVHVLDLINVPGTIDGIRWSAKAGGLGEPSDAVLTGGLHQLRIGGDVNPFGSGVAVDSVCASAGK
jgi:hypothetical protein